VPLDPTAPQLPAQPDLPGVQLNGPKEGKSGGLYTPSSLRVKGAGPFRVPEEISSIPMPAVQSGPALGSAGPSLVTTMIGLQGCVRGGKKEGGGAVR
jgi:hypothetical protein